MLRRLMQTNDSVLPLILRLVLGVTFFAHGAQKVFGWFGGYGFEATMGAYTGMLGIPAPIAVIAIAAEFLGGLGLIFGALSRVAAFGIASVMVVAVAKVHWVNGFFANWTGQQKGEGIEYHLLVIAIAVVIMIAGAGKFSIDRAVTAKAA